MKHYTEEIKNDQSETDVIKHFYFKVNNSKLNNKNKFRSQINKVIERIKSKHNVLNSKIVIKTGTIDDDFIYNRFHLKISFYKRVTSKIVINSI